MTAPLFLIHSLDGDVLTLTGDEGRHAATVRRVQPGERVDVGDGSGNVAECVVTTTGRDTVTLRVERRRAEPPPQPRLVVVQALAKGDRAEDAVEAMTEVGVDEFVPWAAARSIVQWSGPRGDRARERWRTIARAAAKQSRRAWLPAVADLASTADVAARLRAASLAVVLHEAATEPLPDPPESGDIVIVVGPEGGITDDELTAFGTTPYRLGRSVLRTSTAGVAAASVLLSRSGRWR